LQNLSLTGPRKLTSQGFVFMTDDMSSRCRMHWLSFWLLVLQPIIFTLGSTAVWVARDFFTQSIEAASQLGKRAVLLIGDERNRLPELPDHIFAADYAPYQSLLPHATVVVHSGGAGQPPRH
jgi:hypothetical protein